MKILGTNKNKQVLWFLLFVAGSSEIMLQLTTTQASLLLGGVRGVSALAASTFVPKTLRRSVPFGRQIVRGGAATGNVVFPPRPTQPLTVLQQAATTSPTPTMSDSTLQDIAKECADVINVHALKLSNFDSQQYWDTSDFDEFRVLFILGGPGAGKGTQSAFMEQDYPVVHLSVGDLLRKEVTKPASPHKTLIEECLVGGKIVPVEISLALLQQAMQEASNEKGRSLLYLVDGFPRNFDNLEGWVRCMKGISSVWGTLVYKCPLEELERRILNRAATSGRSDDNIQSAQKRFKTFEQETMPVVDVLKIVQEVSSKQNVALQVEEIDGNQSIEQVWEDTQGVLNKFVAHDVWTANAQLLRAIQQDNVELYKTLTSPDMVGDNDIKSVMLQHEGDDRDIQIANPKMEHISGSKVIVSYDRTLSDVENNDQVVRETRVWSHQGSRGWVNVHFSRTPAS